MSEWTLDSPSLGTFTTYARHRPRRPSHYTAPSLAPAISAGSGIRGHVRRWREHVLSPKGRGEPGCASLTRATTRSPDKAKGRIRDGHPNHPRSEERRVGKECRTRGSP